eukprot:NODE_189_length_2071_cov_311.611771_g149_i0.p1 GENE.NODE_189_length_2071_cov_311.611771_g149_i0~~NODE_189_length_2071_cov_311.611771_g149_i0.p1  ORF type:complete len:562 (+),score=109.73 NODE_189_length_2071_cov_311.611771_g149_i0:320-2005(+)
MSPHMLFFRILCVFVFHRNLVHSSDPCPQSCPTIGGVTMGGHDMTLVVFMDCKVQIMVEVDKVAGCTFGLDKNETMQRLAWRRTWAAADSFLRRAAGKPPLQQLDLIVANNVEPSIPHYAFKELHAQEYLSITHHQGHAAVGFYTSPFETALILTMDGGGDDGCFNMFLADRSKREVRRLYRFPECIGWSWFTVWLLLLQRKWRHRTDVSERPWKNLMTYAALGTPRDNLKKAIRPLMKARKRSQNGPTRTGTARILESFLGRLAPNVSVIRDFAASAQAVLEDIVLERVDLASRHLRNVDGIVLSGGCALNSVVNDRLRERHQIPIYVPPQPGDAGIALGAVFSNTSSACAPLLTDPFLGFPLDDLSELPQLANSHNAVEARPAAVADLLAREKLVGIVQGRQPLGSRGLGRRTILGAPISEAIKQRMFSMEPRIEWDAPTVVIPLDQLARIVQHSNPSPHLSFASTALPEVVKQFPAAVHVDGRIHFQTVTAAAHPFLHSLLLEVGTRIGTPMLLTVSYFSGDGCSPALVNTAHKAITRRDGELDAVVVETFLFTDNAA